MIDFNQDYRKKLQNIRFIDLFAGIGGFRYAMEYFGAKCVFSSEWDKHAQECYKNNFGEVPEGDITKIKEETIPAHDFICAGFPCQAFSISGHRKGFDDTRGTLFFDVARIAKFHQPKILLLENVKNFARHDFGNTLKTVLRTLDEIGYTPFYKVINSSLFGVPQRRERIYFVAFHKNLNIKKYKFPSRVNIFTNVIDIVEKSVSEDFYLSRNDINIYKNTIIEKDMFNNYPQKPLQIGKINKGGQGERIYSLYGHAVTQSATTGGPGGTTGLYYFGGKIRKLTPKESSRVQGFPENFKVHKTKTHAWKQVGNSVAINVIQTIIKSIIDMGIDNMNEQERRIKLGSETAKSGFRNEDDVVEKFNNWKNDEDAQKWLIIMNYELNDIEYVTAVKLSGYKTDVQVQVTIKLKKAIDVENLQVKLVSNLRGFNQIDKRWLDKYDELWNFPTDIKRILKYFTGELAPYKNKTRDLRRMFLDEFSEKEQKSVLDFLNDNKALIVNDILKGRGKFAAEWILVVQKIETNARWVLKPMNIAINHFSSGEIKISPRGSVLIGRITVQRKGGDGGRPTSNMLQFKINPAELFDI